ncbi:MAG: hypothetical protein IVW57_05175 [Ktedonobacterales bacterium]|nr:hypothetical protein [Ktedonobacterales bacterium]
MFTATNYISITFTITARDNAAGSYTLSVLVPAYTAAGQYWVHVTDAAGGVFSHTSFQVLAAPLKPVAKGTTPPSHASGSGLMDYLPFGILALVVVIAVVGMFLASRAGRPAPTPAARRRAPPDRYR